MTDVTYDIDSLCEEYEAFRNAGNTGPESIRHFLDHVDPVAARDRVLLADLIQIDIQLNWMSWDKRLSGLNASELSVTLMDQFLKIPRLSSYIEAFPCLVSSCEKTLPMLARCEFESRNRWGDSIGCVYYLETYGIYVDEDSRTSPKVVKCMIDGSSVGRSIPCFVLRGRTILGRQRSRDTSDSFSEELAWGNRIVVANKLDNCVSREQLAVQLLNSTHAIVTNLSAANAILIANLGTVKPHQSVVVKFDFVIRLPNRRLHFSAS